MVLPRALILVIASIAALLVPGVASAARATGVEVMVYGKFDTQIQLAICFEAGTAAEVTFDRETLAYESVLTGPDGSIAGRVSDPAPGVRFLSTSSCRYGYVGVHDIRDLRPGTTYTATTTATLTDDATGDVRTLTDALVVTTTGGCPLDAPEESPPQYTYLHAIVDDANVVTAVHSIAPGTILQAPWSAYRYVPTYYGWPGKQYAGIGFIYDPVSENFGPPLPAGGETPEGDILELAGAEDCASTPGVDVDVAVAAGSADNCAVDADAIVGLAAGPCALTVSVRRSVRAGGSRTMRALLVVRGTGTRPVRPVRPQSPTRPSAPSGENAGTGRAPAPAALAGGVAWTTRTADRRVSARFPAARGLRYRAIARRAGSPAVRTRCRVASGMATCTLRLPVSGTWTMILVPTRGKTAGTPMRSRVVV